MNKVLTISLNGNAYQLEEAAYEALRNYLDAARKSLAEDPDVEEIMQDLEQAIADKLSQCSTAHKSVANLSDIKKILSEMGSVNSAQDSDTASRAGVTTPGPKRLYRLTDERMLFGVCAGAAAYLDVDVTIVRVVALILLLVTGGGFAIAYVIAVLFIPEARTKSEREAAHGTTPLTAQDIIESVRAGYESAMGEYHKWYSREKSERRARARELKRLRKQEQHWWRHQRTAWQNPHAYYGYRHRPSAVGEVAQVLFLALAIYLLYTYVPQTDAFFNYVWHLIHQGWSWIFGKIAVSAS